MQGAGAREQHGEKGVTLVRSTELRWVHYLRTTMRDASDDDEDGRKVEDGRRRGVESARDGE